MKNKILCSLVLFQVLVLSSWGQGMVILEIPAEGYPGGRIVCTLTFPPELFAPTILPVAPPPLPPAPPVSLRPFVRSDQHHLGRAPRNTRDLMKLVNRDFSDPETCAARVIQDIRDNPSKLPVLIGCVHSWDYNANAQYRKNVHLLTRTIREATGAPLLLYLEEQNASHQPPQPIREELAGRLRGLSQEACFAMASYCNGAMDRGDVVRTVRHFKDWYGGRLGIDLDRMWIDMDTSQTPANFYYGTRGRLENFNQVVRWALGASFEMGFGGFHTYGNSGTGYGTQVASDSTYQALDRHWADLMRKHPERSYPGRRKP